jgi:nucleoside-diphosphate-sugar epimerase
LNKNISIIGCGWLGFPLAMELIKKGHLVKGTTTSKEKIALLNKENIKPFNVEITETGILGLLEESLSKSDILVLNIPPGIKKKDTSNYVAKIEHLIPYIENSQIKRVLFISSTSVYADTSSFPVITEQQIPNPMTNSGKQLLKAETLLKNNIHFKTTFLRFAGLYGDHRHPAKFLSGKTNLKNPTAPVNLIHLNDCIGIIINIIEKDVFGDIFNASTTPHPTKQDYYTSVCNSMNLEFPHFDLQSKSKGKIVNSEKIVNHLNYQFQINL